MDVCTYGRPSAGLDAKGTDGELPARIHFGGGGEPGEKNRKPLIFLPHAFIWFKVNLFYICNFKRLRKI